MVPNPKAVFAFDLGLVWRAGVIDYKEFVVLFGSKPRVPKTRNGGAIRAPSDSASILRLPPAFRCSVPLCFFCAGCTRADTRASVLLDEFE